MASGGDDPGAQDGQPRRMRSGPSQLCSLVRFINTTQRSIDIIWLNYEGIGVVYRTLRPRQYVHVNTFVGHPWIFRDSATGDRMCVQTRDVYEPISSVTEAGRARRRLVYITNPLYTLRERCLQEVRRCVPSNRIEQLELPRDILRDLLIRQPDVPILSSTMTSQDRQSTQPSTSSVPSLASLADPSAASTTVSRRNSPSSSGAPQQSAGQAWASSASDSDVASSSVIQCRSSIPSAAGARVTSGTCSNACTSTRSVTDDQPDAQCETERSLVRDRCYVIDSDFMDGSQLMNNNNNDQAMNWNCNNNSSSAINQNIQRSAEVSSSDAQQHNGDVTDGSSAVSSSSSRQTVTSLRDRLLYQYLECSNGHDIVSSQVVADGNWSNGCASMRADRPDRSSTSDATPCQLSSQSVVDSSSGFSSLASCSSEPSRTSGLGNMGQVSGRSSTCTVTSSSEYLVAGSNEAMDDGHCINESEAVVEPMPSSSAVDHPQTGHEVSSIDAAPQSPNSSRIPSSSWDVLGNSDSSSVNIDQSFGPCHSNSELGWHHTQSAMNNTDESSARFVPECESSDQNGGILDDDCVADGHAAHSDDREQENNVVNSSLSNEHQSVNSTSNEGGKHGLSRVNETRLPFKKHRP